MAPFSMGTEPCQQRVGLCPKPRQEPELCCLQPSPWLQPQGGWALLVPALFSVPSQSPAPFGDGKTALRNCAFRSFIIGSQVRASSFSCLLALAARANASHGAGDVTVGLARALLPLQRHCPNNDKINHIPVPQAACRASFGHTGSVPMAVHGSLQVGPAHRVPDVAAPVANQVWDSSELPQQDQPKRLCQPSPRL